jgi:hypothetical protein
MARGSGAHTQMHVQPACTNWLHFIKFLRFLNFLVLSTLKVLLERRFRFVPHGR